MPQTLRWGIIVCLVIAFVAVGYLRDFIAINLNYHLHFLDNNYEYSSAHSFFDFLNNYSYKQVYNSKYAMTLIFTLLNFVLGAVLLIVVLQRKQILKIYTWLYLVLVLVSMFFFGGGYLIDNAQTGYHFSRILMGFLQSPLPAAVLVFGFPLYIQSTKQ